VSQELSFGRMNTMNEPLITIGIAAFNAEDTIIEALESAITQTWRNKEIIIVDDCSSDRTIEIISKYRNYKNIFFYANKFNKGIAFVRNQIIKLSKGEFIAFFDDDDVSDPKRVEKQYQRIYQYEKRFNIHNHIICHTSREVIRPNQEKYNLPVADSGIDDIAPHGEDVAKRILFGLYVKDCMGAMATCSQMSRRSSYLDINLFDENFRRSEDTELNIRFAISGAHFIGINEILVRQNSTLSDQKKLKYELDSQLKYTYKYKEFIERNYSFDFLLLWIETKYRFLARNYLTFFLYLAKCIIFHPVLSSRRLIMSAKNIKTNFFFSDTHK